MDKQRRKQLAEQYKEMKTYMGVIALRNLRDGRLFVAGYPNLKNKEFTLRMQLDAGRFANLALQKDYTELGGDAFAYEVLEQKPTDKMDDVAWEVKQLTKAYFDKLQPFGERGYNKPIE